MNKTFHYNLMIGFLFLFTASISSCGPADATLAPTISLAENAAITTAPNPTIVTTTTSGIDYSQAFFDPQSEADLSEVIDAPSPIDDPANFADWQDGYLAAVNTKLQNYTGAMIDGGKLIVGVDSGSFGLNSTVWPVIASYKFTWKGEEILTKTLVVSDRQGNLIPLSITYAPTSSAIFNTDQKYQTPNDSQSNFLKFQFVWTDNEEKLMPDEFSVAFLPENDTNLDAPRRAFSANGTADDREILSRSHFIWYRFLRNY
ncbi:MAG TPA: hypothetical protein VMC62_11610 [Longilinea sp.]|nr:hypothetical protein [Longilinea sp.]